MTVCNVGDSRVLLGHRIPSTTRVEESKEEEKVDVDTEMTRGTGDRGNEGDILPIPLTLDQTPYRRDERERVKKFGAEIRSIDGKSRDDWGDFVHGDTINVEGDPPRVWVKGKDYPGAAFTRSLGDRIAEDVGVTADPEIITKTLTRNDEFLVIASDGIFEFLTNSYVMNVCSISATPLEACERLTRAAYDQWLVHENRTDDITIIVCFLSCSHTPTREEEPETTESLVEAAKIR
jgi:serine/threonine protein phosphatase PrpC